MAPQSTDTALHQINTAVTDFFGPVIHKYHQDPALSKTLLSQKSESELIESVLKHPQFSAEYRKQLADIIEKQYNDAHITLTESSPVTKNIANLRLTNTVTVTTGQQIHIFLGPFFVINKILSCCAMATELAESSSKINAVPIFWMATEDHDFEEISKTKLYNETYNWDIQSNGPVGRINPASLIDIVAEARERIDQSAENLHFLDICEQAYRLCSSFADANRYIIHHYFEKTGIVVLDADNSFLKKQFTREFQADIIQNSAQTSIDKSIKLMKDLGVKAPINTRPIQTFYLTDSNRIRIERNGTSFHLIDASKQFSQEELIAELQLHPERFSPNALLRAVYQQKILPNVTYVTGASEFVYWLELEILMASFNINFPQISLRKSTFFLSDKNRQYIDNAHISINDLFLIQKNFKTKILTSLELQIKKLSDQIDVSKISHSKLIETLGGFNIKKSNRLEKIYNQLLMELGIQFQSIIDAKSDTNGTLNRLLKIKALVFDDDYVQERDKYVLSMVNELELSLKYYLENHKIYLDYRTINMVIT